MPRCATATPLCDSCRDWNQLAEHYDANARPSMASMCRIVEGEIRQTGRSPYLIALVKSLDEAAQSAHRAGPTWGWIAIGFAWGLGATAGGLLAWHLGIGR